MTPPAAFARVSPHARLALPWLIGAAVVLLRHGSLELVPAARCPALIELTVVGTANLLPDASLGTLLGVFHAVSLGVAVALYAMVAARATASLAVAAACGFALGLSPFFPDTLAPPREAAAFAVFAGAALLFLQRIGTSRAHPGRVRLTSALCAVVAALMFPGWTIALAALAAAVVVAGRQRNTAPRSTAIALAAALAVVALAVGLLVVFPPDLLAPRRSWATVGACLAPGWGAGITGWPAAISRWLGPYTVALAALGAFTLLDAARVATSRWLVPAAAAILLIVLAPASSTDAHTAVAPVVVVLWALVAFGVKALASILQGSPARRLVLVAMVLLLPALQASRRVNEERDDRVMPLGHERVDLQQLHAMLAIVPAGAAYVEEDASVDLLLRSAALNGRRSRKPFDVIPRTRDDVERAAAIRPVFAFALGQRELRDRGFVLRPLDTWSRRPSGTIERHDGLAAVSDVRPCVPLGESWADISVATRNGRIAFVADHESSRGPILLFTGGAARIHPEADGWSMRAMRGFNPRLFTQAADPRPLPRLAAEAAAYGLSPSHPVLREPIVVTLKLHRVPNAPLALAVTLGAPFPQGVGRLHPEASSGGIRVCDASATLLTTFASR